MLSVVTIASHEHKMESVSALDAAKSGKICHDEEASAEDEACSDTLVLARLGVFILSGFGQLGGYGKNDLTGEKLIVVKDKISRSRKILTFHINRRLGRDSFRSDMKEVERG